MLLFPCKIKLKKALRKCANIKHESYLGLGNIEEESSAPHEFVKGQPVREDLSESVVRGSFDIQINKSLALVLPSN